jgi:adenosyl cobinamide kinase/adenosyl cobinamide phosphate guanylyltransferase
VEIKPLAQMLEDLLYDAGDAGLEVCLSEAICETGMDWAAVRAEYQQRYQRAVDIVAELRGEPSFVGRAGGSGYPPWLEAEEASCWSDAAGVVYVALRNSSESISMLGGGRPHPVKREAITLLPPAD